MIDLTELMTPWSYHEEAYRESLRQRRREETGIVYDVVFVPPHSSKLLNTDARVLIAATSTGYLHVYILETREFWEERPSKIDHLDPVLSLYAHHSRVYTVCFVSDRENPLVISGSDHEICVWKWHDIVALAQTSQRARDTGTLVPTTWYVPRTTTERGGVLPYYEINAMEWSTHVPNALWVAGGDTNAYEWDIAVEKPVRTYQGHQAYLHDISYTHYTQQVITASEDGTIGIWDRRSEKALRYLSPKLENGFVRTIAIDTSSRWLACGGGSGDSGFWSLWHLPTFLPVHQELVDHHVHSTSFLTNTLLSVGNDDCIRRWNVPSCSLMSATISTNRVCHQFCVVDPSTRMIATGGDSNSIDIHLIPGVISFSLCANSFRAKRRVN
uniref:Uncharacterized protein AlNc14C125G6781 n=1 Tax=Albugo laibachii Nc14 TaxID=890382 RepID=F0WJQ5_9STRA|nr:conserved hypothetical protein [Albugo laibachii Nc14]|eukprot:CCA21506.1 conserved hypothetical protein [Albugo laibachii Nc14]